MYRSFSRAVKSFGCLAGILAIFGCLSCPAHGQTDKKKISVPGKLSPSVGHPTIPVKKPAMPGMSQGPKTGKTPGETPTTNLNHDHPTTEHPKTTNTSDQPRTEPHPISEKSTVPASGLPAKPAGFT